MAFMRKLLADQTGTSAVEYGLICSLMVIGLVVGIQGLGASVAGSFNSTADKVRLATLP
jgi:Flp pilus assembly pilin Flp